MRIATSALAVALAAGMSIPAAAQEEKGPLQVKLLGTAVLVDGKITDVRTDTVGLPANTQTSANNNVVPTVAIEYFFNDNLSLETICCVTQHDVDGVTGLPGAELVSDARLIPATFTLKYHINTDGGIKPYVGAGPAYFIFFDEDPGAATVALGVTDFDLSDELGFALQAGVDIPVGKNGASVSLDAKRYFIDTDATWSIGGAPVIETTHKLDPWVLSAGIAYRF
ncbi:OmpW family outer membrane protein [Pontixanthobacter aestiaquae]|uniref:Outer membrane beta-barrel protein n=1 Tax=Pontixanthobacter aestiaquae TaxID=1509367 RepID=A0A844Z4N0_9SPHN|nr:OmpW family outer membrane protein [Pontixanthobacter aestiaquae]MDN3647254.1 OmpW family outer membrane protein [Pontixanthobacter aestiaquae]MXO81770.1 outer membrane beta-barrel protein [Pontixanthobacter aestiaquae]